MTTKETVKKKTRVIARGTYVMTSTHARSTCPQAFAAEMAAVLS